MNKKRMIWAIYVFGILSVAALITLYWFPHLIFPAERVEKLIVTVQPVQNPIDLKAASEELREYLEKKTGIPVEIYIPTDYAQVIEALRFGNTHVAMMGSWPAYLAVKNADAEVLLAEVRTVAIDGEKVNATFYYSYWIVPMDSPYQSLSDLRGKKVCFPSRVSSSGYLAPLARMVELGLLERKDGRPVDSAAFFGEVIIGGGYGQCWEALKAGHVDVTVIAGDVSYSLYAEAMSSSRVLETQGPLPSHAVVVARDLSPELKQKIKDAFQGLSDPQYSELMRRFISALFVGFEERNTEEHLTSLDRYLELTGLGYS
jgi:phosphonate transport system substrate-binding protein